MQVLTWDGQLLALELPQTVDLEIVETHRVLKVLQRVRATSQQP